LAAVTPEVWASKAIALYHELRADCIVAETNYGGAMVEAVRRAVDPNIPYRSVTATREKLVRAKPICAAFERERAHVVGELPELEQEFCSYVPGAASPNRLDAAVWACTELGGDGGGLGLLELYKELSTGKHLELLYDADNAPAASTENYGDEDRDHPCIRCHHVPVKKIDSIMRECPACSARFTVGPTMEPQSRGAYLAEQDDVRSRWGFPAKGTYAERGGFGRFGRR
jgi:hypothetical protein